METGIPARRQAGYTEPSKHICMDFTEAVRQGSFPLNSCSKTQRRKRTARSAGRSNVNKQCLAAETRRRQDGQEAMPHRVSLTLSSSQETVPRDKQFGSPCKFCGERFGKHSLHLHQRKCESVPSDGSTCTGGNKHTNQQIPVTSIAGEVSVLEPTVSHSMEAASNSQGVYQILFELPHRPRTRTLERSVLVEKGYSLPSIEFTKNTIINGGSTKLKVLCKTCGELIASERAALHQRNCRSIPRTVARGEITFPSLSQRESSSKVGARTTQDLPNSQVGTIQSKNSQVGTLESKKGVSRQPPTVVCYICGREYGSKSISIHEPQCLKKFELENRKLPINERKPLPKKAINHVAVVVNLMPRERMVPWSLTGGIYQNAVLQDMTEQYFQSCYSEWEKDLIPCKTCGRKFAPERHAKHAHRCKAKPLPHKQN